MTVLLALIIAAETLVILGLGLAFYVLAGDFERTSAELSTITKAYYKLMTEKTT